MHICTNIYVTFLFTLLFNIFTHSAPSPVSHKSVMFQGEEMPDYPVNEPCDIVHTLSPHFYVNILFIIAIRNTLFDPY